MRSRESSSISRLSGTPRLASRGCSVPALKRSARRESSRTEPPASKGSHRAKRVLRSSGCCGFDWSRQQRHSPIDRRIGVAAAEPVPSAPVADSEVGPTSPITCPRGHHSRRRSFSDRRTAGIAENSKGQIVRKFTKPVEVVGNVTSLLEKNREMPALDKKGMTIRWLR